MAGSRLTVAMASPCSGRMKLDSSVSMALTSHSASTAAQAHNGGQSQGLRGILMALTKDIGEVTSQAVSLRQR